MQFARLRLAGFKSFADAAEIEIRPGLTGIVGPNGCGKSNLLEALRWVMGEGSARALRSGGGGMDDVIFAGTERQPRKDQAVVQLTLDTRAVPDAADAPESLGNPADADEITVERRVLRGSGSVYRLNGREVRQKDVRLLFADAATGAGSPALVSQGQVAALIRARPQERRQLLEEAAGIAGLGARRHEAEQRLQAVVLNLARAADNLHGLQKQAAGLERQARAATRYRQLSERIRAAEEQLLWQQWLAVHARARQLAAEVAQADADLAAAGAELAAQEQLLAQAAAAIADKRAAQAQATSEYQQVAAGHAAASSAHQAAVQRLADLATAVADARTDVAREDARASDAAASLAQLRGDLEAQRTAAAAAQAAGAGQQRAEAAAQAAATRAAQALQTAVDAQAALLAEARALQRAADAGRSRLEVAQRNHARQQAEIARLGAPAAEAELARQLRAAETAQQQLDRQLQAAAADIVAADTAAATARQQQDAAQSARAALAAEVAALEAEAAGLQRLHAVRPQQGGADSAPLRRQLIAAPGQEAALAAALGADVEAAVGEAAGRHWRLLAGAVADPPLPAGCRPLAAEVQAPRQLARLLAQTGIVAAAPDAELLRALRPGQQLVSLDGWLWRWDGLVAPPGAGAGAIAEILRQANRLRTIEQQLPQPRARLAAAETALQAARQRVQQADASGRTAQDRRRALEQGQARQTAQRHELERRSAEAARQRQGAEAQLQRLQAELQAAASELVAAEAAVQALPDSTAAAATLAQARAADAQARTALADARAQAVASRRAIEDAERQARRLQDSLAAWEARRRDAGAAQAALRARLQRLQAEAAALAPEPERLAAEIAQTAQTEAALQARATAAQAALQAAEAQFAGQEQARRRAEAAVASARERRAVLRAGQDRLQADVAALAQQSKLRFGCLPGALAAASGEPAAEVTAESLAALVAERDRIGAVNLRADAELAELQAEIVTQESAQADLQSAVGRLRGSIGALNREGRVRLLAAFHRVDQHFRQLFATLFAGGIAELELVEDDDPLLSGLEIRAQPPGKKLQSLSLLSGGEQALTAIALVFALFHANAAPICVLDEVDAPLDDANVDRLTALLAQMAHATPTRFLVVTHNPLTMAAMQRLYGVTMAEPGVSQLVSVELQQAQRFAGS